MFKETLHYLYTWWSFQVPTHHLGEKEESERGAKHIHHRHRQHQAIRRHYSVVFALMSSS